MITELERAYHDALHQQAASRNKAEPNSFDWKVASSIFVAGLLALEDNQLGDAQYRVVSAPTGSGKSSFAQAFIKAYISVFPEPSALFLVETIDQAEATYRDMATLLGPSSVAVWTSAHDKITPKEEIEQRYGFVPLNRFDVDDLEQYPVVIVTHKFYSKSRAHKAINYKYGARKLTFVDEKAADVSLYDVDTGLIKTVRDRLTEKQTSTAEASRQLTLLHDYLESVWQCASGNEPFDVVPANINLAWFQSDQANEYTASADEQVSNVFGFGRTFAKGFAFLSRYDAHGNGARFIGYELAMPLRPGTVLLDATADIDGVSLVVADRKPVATPKVSFSNLTITHIKPPLPKRTTVRQVVQKAKLARPYASWIRRTIVEHSQPGEQVLAVVHKGLLDHDYLPDDQHSFERPYDLEGRQVCFIHWGTGIGSNRWKDASAVFLFGEFHVPKRSTVGTWLALNNQAASPQVLAPFQGPNTQFTGFLALKHGHLCRWEKQLAMRGNARNIDENGVCGSQRLYVTSEFERFIRYKDLLFPGAKLSIKGSEQRLAEGGAEGLATLLYTANDNVLTVGDVKQRTGVSIQKNGSRYLSLPLVQSAITDKGWTFVPGRGRGNPGRFVRIVALAA